MERLSCFKAYDVRGKVPGELNAALATKLGLAYAQVVQPVGPVAVGYDIRPSSAELAAAVRQGLHEGGVPTRGIGLGGTEMVYHAAAQPGAGGGIMVTASHNPEDENGLKLVVRDPRLNAVRPLTAEVELPQIEELVRTGRLTRGALASGYDEPVWDTYLPQLLRFVDPDLLAPLKVVVDAGNGGAGLVVDRLAEHLPFDLVRVRHEPNGSFPHGIPNPLLKPNQAYTAQAVQQHGADLGVAWDGDFDRCFFFDAAGTFIEGYYVVGLLAENLLAGRRGSLVVHDPRLYWNTWHQVTSAGGVPVKCRTGHARIKAMMVAWDCLYGGEMSAHHYFRDFHHCDSGQVPWLLVAALMSQTGRPLADLVDRRQRLYPCSGEINREVPDPTEVFRELLATYAANAPVVDFFDGLSMTFGDAWRFNLRQSDTEPTKLRLNVETRADAALLADRTAAILDLIDRHA